MKSNQLFRYDPSRHAAYQMVEYVLQGRGETFVWKEFPNMFLVKADPFQNEVYNYNYAHFFEPEITEADLTLIDDFFQGVRHGIKFPRNEVMSRFLGEHWYVLKYEDDVMLRKDTSQDISFILPDTIALHPVNNEPKLQQYAEIYSVTFEIPLEAVQQQFGFYNAVLIDSEDIHTNAFLLYEHGDPVATGAYYAFDTFSIENIGTLPEARGKGYAQIIVKKLLQEARKLWYPTVVLGSSPMWVPVYKKLGFTTLHEATVFVSLH